MSFKLLAIRPMPGTDPKFLKNLKPGVIYKFYQEYGFYADDEKKIRIDELPFEEQKKHVVKNVERTSNEVPENLYSQDGGPSINISAVVGKNGSGKSSLVELFYRFIYDISVSKLKKKNSSEFVIDLQKEIEVVENLESKIELKDFNSSKKYFYREIEDEIYAKNKKNELTNSVNKLFKLMEEKKSNPPLTLEVFIEDESEKPDILIIKDSFQFYNIVLNHSAYSLNSNLIGNWIEKIFHKNDGYETPIVINPMRTNGNIDINNELHLVRSRLLLNTDITKIFKKEIKEICFYKSKENRSDEIYYKRRFTLENNFLKRDVVDKNNEKINNEIIDIKTHAIALKQFEEKLNHIFNKELIQINDDEINYSVNIVLETPLEEEERIKKGIIKVKLYEYLMNKICKYAISKSDTSQDFMSIHFDLDLVLNKIRIDFSHQTFKFYQILHLLKIDNFEAFFELAKNSTIEENEIEIKIQESEFKNYLKSFKFLEVLKQENNIWKVPGAFFSSDFTFKNEAEFSKLSSGEVQILNSLNTIIYHLRNIDSIEGSYEHVNLIFDEVELYFHVDYQRVFISKLLEAIKNAELKRIKNINIQFLTHSPFILSDIPSQNILRLKDGKPVKAKNDTNSFAANIHDLLADEFFLEDGFMGEFAKKEINNWIKQIRADNFKIDSEKEYLNWLNKIELIGEPVLKSSITNVLKSKTKEPIKIEKRLEELRREMANLIVYGKNKNEY